mmetsp:Transcript_19132/g.49403  ORF Transcript_19132/g.49403 Transcript_19132/m.49403 type:complete len:266 (-) Transcript_19132:175-972(-)|eukprot:CAMPEP_0119414742 /NCGR_PEP_ID=MMETSP1335-20130426/7152_1 /TAXON_ID=259385 /ORGANISM="Chrysoculter rhomboideus, Strain RCC1486" /LENGTH=265 /DNA_ID=CAMNT_0007439631 /DNA_START=16 /DNA_END=813 /DNA_ORIENTATION=+
MTPTVPTRGGAADIEGVEIVVEECTTREKVTADSPTTGGPAAGPVAVRVDGRTKAVDEAGSDAHLTPELQPVDGEGTENHTTMTNSERSSKQHVCFICLESSAPLQVGTICACSSMAVHLQCLENYLNHSYSKRTRSVENRLVCSICKEPYRLNYEATMVDEVPSDNTVHNWRIPVLVRAVGAGAWLALGSWLVVLSFKLNNEAIAVSHDPSATYIALISAVCIYLVISSAMYIRCLQVHARGSSASQNASDPPTAIHFVEHNEP